MNRWLVTFAVVFSIAVMAALPGYSSIPNTDLGAKQWTSALSVDDGVAALPNSSTHLVARIGGPFRMAHGTDLRDVDWAKGGNGGDEADAKDDDNGDDEEKDGDEEEKGDDGEKEEEEDISGWDRIWDAPKQG